MTIPDYLYREISGLYESQDNIEFDGNGNEIYHGVAPIRASNSDALWIIAKGIYTAATVGGATIYQMTHVSFLRGQIWDNRASITFP